MATTKKETPKKTIQVKTEIVTDKAQIMKNVQKALQKRRTGK